MYGGVNTRGNFKDSNVVIALSMTPLSLIRIGWFHNGEAYYFKTDGFIWSNRAVSDTKVLHLRYFNEYVNTSTEADKEYGFAVRCLGR